jgi:hypothetical protein
MGAVACRQGGYELGRRKVCNGHADVVDPGDVGVAVLGGGEVAPILWYAPGPSSLASDEPAIRQRGRSDSREARGLLIRSHRQHPAPTCNLSRVVPYLRAQVRGRSWSSVAVDVATDVGQGIFVRGPIGCIFGRRAPNSKSGVSRPGSSTGKRDHRSCTWGLVWHPVGLAQPDHAAAQGQP